MPNICSPERRRFDDEGGCVGADVGADVGVVGAGVGADVGVVVGADVGEVVGGVGGAGVGADVVLKPGHALDSSVAPTVLDRSDVIEQ